MEAPIFFAEYDFNGEKLKWLKRAGIITSNVQINGQPASGLSRSNAELDVIYSDADLTKIYNEANGIDITRHNPITTERIFKAMRECLNICEANDL